MESRIGSRALPTFALLLALGCRASATRPVPPPRFEVDSVQASATRSAPPPAAALAPESAEISAGGTWATARRDLARAPARLWHDGARTFSSGRNWLYLLGATAYAFAEESYEDREGVYFRNHTLFPKGFRDELGALGNGLTLYAGALVWYFWAIGAGDEASHANSKTVLSAMSVTAVTTIALKGACHDSRPDGGSHDFPSGHSSMTMAVAASLDELYGHGAGFPAYGLSALVGLQRLDSGKHDSAAVVFGWVLGYVVGKTVAGEHPPRILGLEVGFTHDEETGAPELSLSRWL